MRQTRSRGFNLVLRLDFPPAWANPGGDGLPFDLAAYADFASAVARIEREWPRVGLVTLWNLSYGPSIDPEMAGFSLLDPDGKRRPAFEAVADWLAAP